MGGFKEPRKRNDPASDMGNMAPASSIRLWIWESGFADAGSQLLFDDMNRHVYVVPKV